MQGIQNRHKAILEIIGSRPVYSQDELQAFLKEQGIQATQATLSRDLKALRISKIPGEGYQIPMPPGHAAVSGPVGTSILSMEFSGQVAVIKTQPGFAPAVAALIDRSPSRTILATLAGDDTVLLVLREKASKEDTVSALAPILPDIQKHIL